MARKKVAFTLVELLAVISIILVLMALITAAFNSLKRGGDITQAAYEISGTLEQARSYAMANNTYVWVGFYEEDGTKDSTKPASAGNGRIVLSVVASKDGTPLYGTPLIGTNVLNPAALSQLGKLVKINSAHLVSFNDGNTTGDTFDTRPAVGSALARIGDITPPAASLTPLQYPLGNPTPTAQYTFTKALQFSPRGEVRINNNSYNIQPLIEIGLQATQGNSPDVSGNNVAIQLTGMSSQVKIYRK